MKEHCIRVCTRGTIFPVVADGAQVRPWVEKWEISGESVQEVESGHEEGIGGSECVVFCV